MRQRHEDLAGPALLLPHIVGDNGNPAGETVLIPKPGVDAFGGVSLLFDNPFVVFEDLIDNRNERIKLRADRQSSSTIPRGHGMQQDLCHRSAVDPKKSIPKRRPAALLLIPSTWHARRTRLYKSTEYISPPSAHRHQVSDCGILLRYGQIIRPFLWSFCLRDSHDGHCTDRTDAGHAAQAPNDGTFLRFSGNPQLESPDLLRHATDLIQTHGARIAKGVRQAIFVRADNGGEALDIAQAFGNDEAMLRQMGAKRVNPPSALSDRKFTCSKQHCTRLLFRRVDRNCPQCRPQGCFGNRLCVGNIGLPALHERLDVNRRDQPHIVSSALPSPVPENVPFHRLPWRRRGAEATAILCRN